MFGTPTHCTSIERCIRSPGPPPLPSPLLDHNVMVRPLKVYGSEAGSIQQILESVLRQETAFQEEHSRLRGVLQKQHEAVVEKVEAMKLVLAPLEPAVYSAAFKTGGDVCTGRADRDLSETFETATSETKDKFSQDLRGEEAIKLAKSLNRARQIREAAALGADIEPEEFEETGSGPAFRLRQFVTGNNFDMVMGIIILLNMAATAIQLQWQGWSNAYKLGLQHNDSGWSDVEILFDALDVIFNLAYLVELVMRLYVFRCSFCKSYFNLLDLVIVASTCSDTFIIKPLQGGEGGAINLSALRIMRFFRIFRMGRLSHLLHTMEHLQEMRILIQTLIVSVRSLLWSVVLIGGIVMASSIVMAQLSNAFLFDESIGIERRQWMYRAFGTTGRSAYSIFVCTFSGTWTQYADPYVEEVGSAFALFFLPFVVFVNFAVMRVVAALFLKQTMRIADLESAQTENLKMKEKESMAASLEKIFKEGDTSKDGAISKDEFHQMLANEQVVICLAKLEIEVDEAVALFGVLCADDGEADYEEFINGALKMNGAAKTVDTLQILHHVIDMHKVINKIEQKLKHL